MRCIFFTLIGVLGWIHGFSQEAWMKKGKRIPPPICYASHESGHSHVAPPYELLNQLKSTAQKQSTISVNYIGFTPAARAAFGFAVEIWERLIYSPVTIHLRAHYQSFSLVYGNEYKDVLGSCGPYAYYQNFENAPLKDHYYPVALVEKLLGRQVTGSNTPDIVAQFNSDFDWYFGTDGQVPLDKHDFVSVVLHEIGHGLGFTGFFYEQEGGKGAYGDELAFPGVFDHFVVNAQNQQLVNQSLFTSPSTELLGQMTGGNLYFKSSQHEADIPRLYAPFRWDSGSSLYHLDEVTYPKGHDHSLMTPFLSRGESVHAPGLALDLLNEMGWNFIHIRHNSLPDVEDLASLKPAEVYIKGDNPLNTSSLYLVHSQNSWADADSVMLKATGTPHVFNADFRIADPAVVEYYFTATDTEGRTFRNPPLGKDSPYRFQYGPDLTPPALFHQPLVLLTESDREVSITATASDNTAVALVKMQYYSLDGIMRELEMNNDSLDHYSAILDLSLQNWQLDDTLYYRIVARDMAVAQNEAYWPETGFHAVPVETFAEPVYTYINNFNTPDNDFISNDFSVYQAVGFDSPALHTPHPYPSPGVDNQTIDLIAVLRIPIILEGTAIMRYNEVVLVEPGELGTQYGDDEFWDYVIVEGSKDGGQTWKPLLNGYDSSSQQSWQVRYNSNLLNNNSRAVGDKELIKSREFSMVRNGNFKAGDTILVRFRLFSDPYAWGWGWMIDDLQIQPDATSSEFLAISPADLMVYPNPVREQLHVAGNFDRDFAQVDVNIINMKGQTVKQEQLYPAGRQLQYSLDTENMLPGLYMVIFRFDNGATIQKKIIRQ